MAIVPSFTLVSVLSGGRVAAICGSPGWWRTVLGRGRQECRRSVGAGPPCFLILWCPQYL